MKTHDTDAHSILSNNDLSAKYSLVTTITYDQDSIFLSELIKNLTNTHTINYLPYSQLLSSLDDKRPCILISYLTHAENIEQLLSHTHDFDQLIHIALSDNEHIGMLNKAAAEERIYKFLINPVSANTLESHILLANQELDLRKKRDDLLSEINHVSQQLNHLDIQLKQSLLNQSTGIISSSQIDPLTNLPNRYLIFDRINQAINQTNRKGNLTAILSIDIDRFSAINQSLGLRCGNQLLRSFSQRLLACTRQTDSVAREGNDEFILVASDLDHSESVMHLIRRIQKSLIEPFIIDEQEIFLSVSIGVCIYPSDAHDAETLLRAANTAMKHAKNEGGNGYQYYEQDMNFKVRRLVDMESSLFRALEKNEFMMHYQPQVDLKTGEIVGAEALLRWYRPEHGIVPPNEFIPILEETGLIEQVGEWILHEVSRQTEYWLQLGLPTLRMSVNLSLRQVQDNSILSKINKLLARFNAPEMMKNIELEITESIMMKDADKAISLLVELNKLGFNFSIDDFGTGYASLNYLTRFPVHSLKIDLSFIHRIETSEKDAAIVRAIILMAHSLGLRVTAEGVETHEQLTFLQNCDCDEIQGYYFSKPLPPDQFEVLLTSGKKLY